METVIWRGGEFSPTLLQLRYEVLRKPQGGDFKSAEFDGDKLQTTLHFAAIDPVCCKLNLKNSGSRTLGAYEDSGQLVGCVSLLASKHSDWPVERSEFFESIYQLRGMAIASEFQSKGIGKILLQRVHEYIDALPGSIGLWCNARLNAVPFYARHQWERVSDEFEIPNVGPHVRMIRRNAASTEG